MIRAMIRIVLAAGAWRPRSARAGRRRAVRSRAAAQGSWSTVSSARSCASAIWSRTPAPPPTCRSSARRTSARPARVPVARIAEACAPHGIDRTRHRRPHRSRGDAASRADHRQGHRATASPARSPASTASATRKISPSTFDREVRTMHVEPTATGDLRGRPHELRAAHRPLRRRASSCRAAQRAARCAALHRHRDRDGRGRDADARRCGPARSSRRPTSWSSAGPKAELGGDAHRPADAGGRPRRRARCAPARRCAPPT